MIKEKYVSLIFTVGFYKVCKNCLLFLVILLDLIDAFLHSCQFMNVFDTVAFFMNVFDIEINVLKDTQREQAPSNKTQALTKSTNMGVWVVGTSN